MRAALKTLAAIGRGAVAARSTFAVLGARWPSSGQAARRARRDRPARRRPGHITGHRRRRGGPADRARRRSGGLVGRRVEWVPDVDAAIALLRRAAAGRRGAVKASRAARLERVALAIADDAPAAVPIEAGASGREDGSGVKTILIAAVFSLLLLDPVHAARRAVLPARAVRPGDPRRRAADPPGQARDADHGRRRDHRLDRARLRRRARHHRDPGGGGPDGVRAARCCS